MAKVKPPVSQWIIDQRKAHGWKVEELSTRLRGMGYEAEVGTIRVWEAGRSPRAETIAGLERLFGSQAPRELGSDDFAADLAEVIRYQAEAIKAQAEAIHAHREATERQAAALLAVLEEMTESREAQKGRDEVLAVALDALAEQLELIRPELSGRRR